MKWLNIMVGENGILTGDFYDYIQTHKEGIVKVEKNGKSYMIDYDGRVVE